MTLVNARAAFEKAVTDTVAAADNTVLMVYDNVAVHHPRQRPRKYILMSVNFNRSPLSKTKARRQDYYSGVIQCNVYVPTHLLVRQCYPAISEAVIDGLTSVNAS